MEGVPWDCPPFSHPALGLRAQRQRREHSFALNGGKLKAFMFWVLGGGRQDEVSWKTRQPLSHHGPDHAALLTSSISDSTSESRSKWSGGPLMVEEFSRVILSMQSFCLICWLYPPAPTPISGVSTLAPAPGVGLGNKWFLHKWMNPQTLELRGTIRIFRSMFYGEINNSNNLLLRADSVVGSTLSPSHIFILSFQE